MIAAMRKAMAPIEGRIRMAIGRAIVTLVDDGKPAQSVQLELLAGERQDGVERLTEYGFTSHPHPEAEAVIACPAGLRSHAIALVVADRRYRLTGLEAGEVALHDDLGNTVLLGRDGLSVIGTTRVDVAAPQVLVTADSATIESDDVSLGATGGEKVARVGDLVDLQTGEILTGSDRVTAA